LAPPARPQYPPPSDPPAMYETTFGGTTLRLVETAGGPRPRFRVEVAGERRRVRVRKEVMDIRNPKAASHEWIEDEDAELPCLVSCLRSPSTKREERNGRL